MVHTKATFLYKLLLLDKNHGCSWYFQYFHAIYWQNHQNALSQHYVIQDHQHVSHLEIQVITGNVLGQKCDNSMFTHKQTNKQTNTAKSISQVSIILTSKFCLQYMQSCHPKSVLSSHIWLRFLRKFQQKVINGSGWTDRHTQLSYTLQFRQHTEHLVYKTSILEHFKQFKIVLIWHTKHKRL